MDLACTQRENGSEILQVITSGIQRLAYVPASVGLSPLAILLHPLKLSKLSRESENPYIYRYIDIKLR